MRVSVVATGIDKPISSLVENDDTEARIAQAEAQASAEVKAAAPELADVEVEVQAVHGRPVSALVEGSKEADLVVVGSRGRGGVAGALLGSVSQGVLADAHCPVAILTH